MAKIKFRGTFWKIEKKGEYYTAQVGEGYKKTNGDWENATWFLSVNGELANRFLALEKGAKVNIEGNLIKRYDANTKKEFLNVFVSGFTVEGKPEMDFGVEAFDDDDSSLPF